MNRVKLEYSCVRGGCCIFINGERISPYSERAFLENKSFLETAGRMVEELDGEIGSPYQLELTGLPFQYKILSDSIENSPYCEGITFQRLSDQLEGESIQEGILRLARQGGISDKKKRSIRIYLDEEGLNLPENMEAVLVGKEEGEIGFFRSAEKAAVLNLPVSLIASEKYHVEMKKGKFLIFAPQEEWGTFWEYFVICEWKLSQVESAVVALKHQGMAERDERELRAYLSREPDYYLGPLPEELESGEDIDIEFRSFPDGFYRLETSDDSVLRLEGNRLKAINKGEALLRILKRSSCGKPKEEGCEWTDAKALCCIRVTEHQYASKIELVPGFHYLKIREKNKIDCYIFPEHAEDAGELIWEVEDPEIVYVQKNGSVTAFREGKTSLHVAGRRTAATLEIEVKPPLLEIVFPEQKLTLFQGEDMIVECRTIPENAPCENLKWNFDNETIASCIPSQDGKRCKLLAKSGYIGKGNLSCTDSETQTRAICNVEVVQDRRYSWLKTMGLIFLLLSFFAPVLLPLPVGISIYGIRKAGNPSYRKSFRFYLIIGCICAFFWMMMAVSS